MKIIVLDGYTENPGDLSWGPLKALGQTEIYDRTEAGETVSRIGDAEAILTNKTVITDEVMEACGNLRYIGVLATGYNVVDVEAAKRRGITVTNIPTYGTDAVGQFAIALLLEICHHIGHHDRTVHEGRWENCQDWCYWDYPLIELAGKTMGIIGFGRIGQATGRMAAALRMRVLAVDEYPNESGRALAEYVDLVICFVYFNHTRLTVFLFNCQIKRPASFLPPVLVFVGIVVEILRQTLHIGIPLFVCHVFLFFG